MAEKEEKTIPVLAVLKNNSTLKNIFLLDNPPPSLSSISFQNQELDFEETLLVGRHPDCNITLEHPSISRFHLRIVSRPCSRSLSVIDLSSVHGTWVSGRKIEQGVRVELKEGDTLQLGGSSRVYRLHWVPLSCAYDIENPFMPPHGELEPLEDGEEEAPQDENGLLSENGEIQKVDDGFEGLDMLLSRFNMITSPENLGLSASLIPEDLYSSLSNDEIKTPLKERNEISGIRSNSVVHSVNDTPQSSCAPGESQLISQTDGAESPQMRLEKQSDVSIWSRRGKPASVSIQTRSEREKITSFGTDPEAFLLSHEYAKVDSATKHLFSCADGDEESYSPDKENQTPNTLLHRSLKKLCLQDTKSVLLTVSTSSSLHGDDSETFTPDKENVRPNTLLLKSMKKINMFAEVEQPKPHRSSPLKNADPHLYQQENMQVFLDKENHAHKVLQERKHESSTSGACAKLETKFALKGRADWVPFQSLLKDSSSKTNSKASILSETSRSGTSVNHLKIEELNCPVYRTTATDTKKWTMVVDTGCLLNKDSWKALQLLQGVKGTNLVIPKIVIQELDCLKRSKKIFRRTTEVYSVLQWIEECMVNTNWWIHVQSSVEETRPIAPTPPTTPPSNFREDNGLIPIGSVPFSPHGSLLEIVSPTAGDHILECALLFRRIRSDGKLILLSNDITLKIKAMAEGLLCETAEEFRESLVNPLSERFLWTNSSPRGPTWSYLDDVVLKEKYYGGPLKKLSRSGEGLKGLKLILLHNSQYRQFTSVS